MTAVTTYTTPIVAGATVHARAEVHMSTKGGTYQAAVHAVLNADPDRAKAYALPGCMQAVVPAHSEAPKDPLTASTYICDS